MKPTGEFLVVKDHAGKRIKLPIYEGLQTFIIERTPQFEYDRQEQCSEAANAYWETKDDTSRRSPCRLPDLDGSENTSRARSNRRDAGRPRKSS